MKKNSIFIACDTTNISKIKKIIRETQTSKLNIGYKFGIEFLNSRNGRGFISKLRNKNSLNNFEALIFRIWLKFFFKFPNL